MHTAVTIIDVKCAGAVAYFRLFFPEGGEGEVKQFVKFRRGIGVNIKK